MTPTDHALRRLLDAIHDNSPSEQIHNLADALDRELNNLANPRPQKRFISNDDLRTLCGMAIRDSKRTY